MLGGDKNLTKYESGSLNTVGCGAMMLTMVRHLDGKILFITMIPFSGRGTVRKDLKIII